MTILGIDPALASLGWAHIEADRPIALDYGLITTEKGLPVCDRLISIRNDTTPRPQYGAPNTLV